MFDCSIIGHIDCRTLALLVGTNIGYIVLTFLPPVVWLLFYLREDEHPEPKRLIVTTFIGGVLIAVPAALLQYYSLNITGLSLTTLTSVYPLQTFFFMALIEEYAKYFVVQNLIMMRPEFDEPIDAMIYMMSSAMGFAAIENALFSLPSFHGEFFRGVELIAGRFLGANLLHVLASGIFGYFLAKAFLSRHRSLFVIAGLIAATLLHTLFNYLILIRESLSEGFSYIIIFFFVLALVVFTEFERLKRKKINLVQ